MTKVRKLDIEYSPDFLAIAIFTAQKGYRLCWLLNQQLNTSFTRLPDFSLKVGKDQEERKMPVFGHEDPLLFDRFYLLTNKHQGIVCIDSPQNMDFLMLIKRPSDQFDMKALLKKLRDIPQVNAAIEADTLLGKASGGLFYDFDTYLALEKNK